MKENKRKRFVALFWFCVTEAHSFKPEVQIPYAFKRVYNTETEIYCVKNISSWYWWAKEIDNYEWIKVNYLRGFHIRFINIYTLFFLFKNAKKIDILYMMHLKPSTIYGILYKFLNPRWKLYISTDFDSKVDKNRYVKPTTLFKTMMYKILVLLVRKCDCISTETRIWKEKLENYIKDFKGKLVYLPTWFNDDYLLREFPSIKSDKEKENIMITIWRIWTYQKNTEMLLKSLEWIDIKDRKVYIIWPVEKDFENKISSFYHKRIDLKGNVIFTWSIYEKEKLLEYYNRAKVFCLTSRWEGFPITFWESLYFWNYLLLTDISWSEDMINSWRNWKIIPIEDYLWFRKAFQDIIENGNILKNKSDQIHKFAIENLSWSKIIKRVWEKLNLKRKV